MSWIEISKWVTHGMMRVMCQATNREISESQGRESVEEKHKKKKKKKRERGKKGREKEGKEGRSVVLPLIYRSSDYWSPSGRKLNSVYLTRATVDPHFWLLCVSHLKRRDSFFYLKNKKPFLGKRFGVTTYFYFYFKRENKIRKKNPKCDS